MISILFFLFPIFAEITAHQQHHLNAVALECETESRLPREQLRIIEEKKGIQDKDYKKYCERVTEAIKEIERTGILPEGFDPEDMSTIHDKLENDAK